MTPQFLYDFASPNAYLAWRVLPGVEARTGIRFERVPVLLGGIFKETGNQSPFYTYAKVRGRIDYERLEMDRFLKKHEIERFVFNPAFPQNSLQMMRGAVAAAEAGQEEAYMAACFRGMWEERLKMDDPSVLKDHLDASGLNGAMLLAKTSEPAVKAKLIDQTNEAVRRGVFGLPSIFVGEEMFFGKDRVADAEIEILRRMAG